MASRTASGGSPPPPDALIVPETWFASGSARSRSTSSTRRRRCWCPSRSSSRAAPARLRAGQRPARGAVARPGGVPTQPSSRRACARAVGPGLRRAGSPTVDLDQRRRRRPMPPSDQRSCWSPSSAWTLRQDPTIARLRVTIDGEPVTARRARRSSASTTAHAYAPYVAGPTRSCSACTTGGWSAAARRTWRPVDRPVRPGGLRPALGRRPTSRAEQVAGVSTRAARAVRGPGRATSEPDAVSADRHRRPTCCARRGTSATGCGMVDRRPDGCGRRATCATGPDARSSTCPASAAQDVKTFLVSRDGSRLVAVVRRDDRERPIVVSRILHGRRRPGGAAPRPPVDVTAPETAGCRSGTSPGARPTSIVVLHPPVTRALFQVRTRPSTGPRRRRRPVGDHRRAGLGPGRLAGPGRARLRRRRPPTTAPA